MAAQTGGESPSRPPGETALSLPPEFFGGRHLEPDALKRRYGFSDSQIRALEAMHPFSADLSSLTVTPFESKEQAAAAVYALMERIYARKPALREASEVGGYLHRKDDGRWHTSLPTISPSATSLSTGAIVSNSAPVDDATYFWHTHPTASDTSDVSLGFSFADLVSTLRTGHGLFVYQNGRPFRMEVGAVWRQLTPAQKLTIGSTLIRLQRTVESKASSVDEKRDAISSLRSMLAQDLVSVTVFERSGINPVAGQRTQVMPVAIATDAGFVQLIPNRAPPQPLVP